MDTRLLKANLQALKRKNPILSDALAAHAVSPDNLEFADTKDAVPTVRYRHWNGDREVRTWLHSRYHPLQEATRFASRHSENANIMLYGFGLGYHVRKIMEIIETNHRENQRIQIMECNLDLLKTAFSLADFSDIIARPDVTFIDGLHPKAALSTMENAWQDENRLVIYRPAVSCLSSKFADLQLFLTHQLLPGQNEDRQQLAASNHHANVQLQWKPISEIFLSHENETAFLVSSGPSLNSYWPVLEQYHDSATLICVGSALRFLLDHEIHPDYVVIMDAMPPVERQLKGCEQLKGPLLFSNFAFSEAVRMYRGPRYMYLCESIPGFPQEQVISTGGSVATAALEIALNMGFSTLLFIGQDLCFAGGHHHVDSPIYRTGTQARDLANYNRTQNVKGAWVSTQPNLLKYRQWIEKRISQHPAADFYNLTSDGLPIAGAPAVTPEDLNQIING